MMQVLFWLLVIAGNVGLGAWICRQLPKLGNLADLYAPDADWPALTVAGVLLVALITTL